MAEGTPSSDVFGFMTDEAVAAIGLDDDEPVSDDSIAPVDQTEASPQAEGASAGEVAEEEVEEQPESEEEGQPSEEQPPVAETEQPKAEEETPPRKIFGRFDSEEQAEASYKSMQALQKRTAERANALETQLSEAMGYLKKVAPVIQQLNQQQQQPVQAVPENFDPSDPQQLQQFVNQQVEQGVQAKLAQLVPQLQQETQQAQTQQQVRQVVTQFQSEVPDFYEGSDTWNQMDEVIRGFQRTENGRIDVNQFPLTLENLRLTHRLVSDPALYQAVEDLYVDPTDPVVLAHVEEASKNPTLLRVLKATPDWVRTQEGMDLARSTARAQAVLGDVDQQASQPNPQQNSNTAFVETGGSGAPSVSAPGRVPDDDWEETVRWWRGNQDNVFGFTGAQS